MADKIRKFKKSLLWLASKTKPSHLRRKPQKLHNRQERLKANEKCGDGQI